MSYVDLHTHLLPGLDDGAPTIEETLRHARRLDAHGVHDVACTPHIKRADFPRIDIDALEPAARRAAARDRRRGPDVRLHHGGELAHERRARARRPRAGADRPGPAPRAVAAARVPVRGPRRRVRRRRRAAHLPRATGCCSRTRSGRGARSTACGRTSRPARCCRSTSRRCSATTARARGRSPNRWSDAAAPTVSLRTPTPAPASGSCRSPTTCCAASGSATCSRFASPGQTPASCCARATRA